MRIYLDIIPRLPAGVLVHIHDIYLPYLYSRHVLDTYFVFLRSRVLVGALALDKEHALIARAKTWLQERAAEVPAYRLYLEKWGDWANPWSAA